MFRLIAPDDSIENSLVRILGHRLTALGDPRIANKPITLFINRLPYMNKDENGLNEYRQLKYNPYNIMVVTYGKDLYEWVENNSDLFSCIITNNDEILRKCDNAIQCSDTWNEYDIKTLLLKIIEENDIQESTYWSQEMEDRWIHENLQLPENGFFLDIGACHAKIISNTYFFEKTLGWNGLGIEPDPEYFSDLVAHRTCYLENVAISPTAQKAWYKPKNGIVNEKEPDSIEIECVRLDYLLDKYNVKEIDLISIDIEGYEKIAWSTFDYKKYNPKVIIVEHTEFGRFDTSFSNQLLQDTDYYIAHTTPLNYILVHKNVKYKQ